MKKEIKKTQDKLVKEICEEVEEKANRIAYGIKEFNGKGHYERTGKARRFYKKKEPSRSEGFNLSENIKKKKTSMPRMDWIYVRNIKEFIRLLKESRHLTFEEGKCFFIMEEDLDKLAGKSLI